MPLLLEAAPTTSGRILNATFNAHSRLGHPSASVENRLGKHYATYAEAANSKSAESKDICEACARGKATRSLPKKSTTDSITVQAPLELVHSDVCGPFSQPSLTDDRYFVVIVDDYTHYMTVYPISAKSAVPVCISDFILRAERFFHNRGGYRVVTLRSDNGGEYMSSRFDNYLANRGITHQTTVPYNSHQNAVSERAIRTLTEKARVMMFDVNTPLSLWAEAVNCATFIVNRLPSTSVKNEYPYKRWYKKFPVLDGLRPFGCLAYAYIPESVRSSKLSPRSIRGVMVGYAPTQHAYRIFDLDSGTVVVSNNVKFDESAFPFRSMNNVPHPVMASKLSSSPVSVSSFFSVPGVLATHELPDTAMAIDQVEVDTLMSESTPMPSLDSLIPALEDLVSTQDVVMRDSSPVPVLDVQTIRLADDDSSTRAVTNISSESRIRSVSARLSSPVREPAVVEPSSPPIPASRKLCPRIEYISDSEASVPGEDYATSFYERHHDNFDKSDDEDYVDEPVRRRRAITMPDRLRRRSEVSSDG